MLLSVDEIKKLLQKWHFYNALVSEQENNELLRKLRAIEKAVSLLNDVNKRIIQMKYFQGYEMNVVAKSVFISRRAAYYRIETSLKEISYITENLSL